jgi:site-specific DNA recombinase
LNGWTLVKIYRDEGISGAAIQNRPAILQAIQDAKSGQFEILICPDMSRLSRKTKDVLQIYEELENFGVQIVLLKERIDTSTPSNRAFRTMSSAWAELERETIHERTHGNKMARWKRADSFVGRVPFGFRWNKEKKQLEIHGEQAQIYRRIVQMKLSGMSCEKIAGRITAEGHPITYQGVHYLLRNSCYTGNYIVNRHQYEGTQKKRDKEGKLVLKPSKEHISFPCPALISKNDWDRIQANLYFNKTKSKRSITPDYWLRDMLVCGECGGRIKPDYSSIGNYRCFWRSAGPKKRQANGKAKCALPRLKKQEIEDLAWTQLIVYLSLGNPSYFQSIANSDNYERRIAELETQIVNLSKELKKKETAKSRLLVLLEADDFNQEDFSNKLRETNDSILSVKARLAESKEQISGILDAKNKASAFLEFIRNKGQWLRGVQEELEALAPQDKKRLVESLVDGKITVYDASCDEGWHEGLRAWQMDSFGINFNALIFEELANEGKISELNQDGSHQPDAFPDCSGPRILP